VLELKVRDGEREVVLQFEHSLHSLSKWEAEHKKPFLSTTTKTATEMINYFQDMLLSGDPDLIIRLSPQQLDYLANYINETQTASSVPPDDSKKGTPEIVTTELIYYWMVALKINWEAQHWHLSRLMMLINITNYKQQPEKKRSTRELLSDWKAIQAKNRERFGIKD
jgi:hypothetical protein